MLPGDPVPRLYIGPTSPLLDARAVDVRRWPADEVRRAVAAHDAMVAARPLRPPPRSWGERR